MSIQDQNSDKRKSLCKIALSSNSAAESAELQYFLVMQKSVQETSDD